MNSPSRRYALPFMGGLILVGLLVFLIPAFAMAQVTLPARIQAEDYDDQSGAGTITTDDTDGGDDLYCMWTGDWTSYDVTVPDTAYYTITVRANGQSVTGDFFRIELDDEDVTGTIGPDTAYQYCDVTVTNVYLLAGSHELKYYQVNAWGYNCRINWIEVTAENSAPSVDAGSDQTVTYPASATLDATVSDDGLPSSPGTYTVTWTKTSGPGTVTFGNSSAVDTTAAFSASGTYVLRLTANDGSLSDYDEVTIEANAAPSVNAGLDDTIAVTSSASLDATVSDDGLPSSPGTYTVTWTKTSGPGTVTFGNSSAVDTTAEFDTVGTYVLRLTADDDDTTAYDEVEITVESASGVAITIQAEDYDDESGAGVIETDDVDGEDDLYCMWIGDWTEYDVIIPSSGDYDITIRTKSPSATGSFFRIEIDDEDVTGTIGPGTAGSYVDVVVENVAITAGSRTLKYYQVNGWSYDARINWIKIESEGSVSNTAPTVDAGVDQDVNLPSTATLDATVEDDGLPGTPGTYTVTWTKQSGPGTVTFGNTSAVDTTAAFSTSGTYVLRLTANDGDLTDYDELTVNVNSAPSVNAGLDDSVSIAVGATLDATVSDDGLPNPPGTYTVTWTKQSGAGTVTFGSSTSIDTTASFSETGVYILRLTANDDDATAYDEVQITVNPAGTAPIVNAGLDDAIFLSGSATLDATVTDDGLPNPPGTYTVTWTKTSGPGTATFGNSSAVDTTVAFDTIGTYVLRLTANDGDLPGYDEVTVVVIANGVTMLPARIQAEDYDDESGVGTISTNDVDGVTDLYTLWIADWASYDVGVPATDMYTITIRVRSPSATGGFFRIEIDDEDVTGTIGPSTAGEYVDVVATGVQLTAGTHVLKYYQVNGWSYDARINWIEVGSDSNDPAVVDAGSDQVVTLPGNSVTLDATVTDDGNPNPPGACTYRWTVTSGSESGYVDFDDKYAVDTSVVFDTAGVYVLRLSAYDGDKTTYDEMQVTVNEATSRVTLPVRLEAEDYSDQGEGVSYHDTTSGNAGSVYRSDDVDIEACGDSGGGYDVYTIAADEWLAFDIKVPADTTCYDIIARVNSSTSSREMHVEVDGVDVTGAMTFDATGGWINVTAEGVRLSAGDHVVKVVMDTGDFKLNYVDILAETYEEYIVEGGVANADIVISSSPLRTATLAADELQDIIYDITGATLPIVTPPTGADVHIYVGESSYTSSLGISTTGLEHDAYKILTGSNWMALVGHDTDYTPIYPYGGGSTVEDDWDDLNYPYLWQLPYAYGTRTYAYDTELDIWNSDGKGSLNAVYAFLYDVGCRWYFPGSIGEVVPNLDDIGLPGGSRTIEPEFALREFYQTYTEFGRSNNADEVRWQLRLGLNDGRDSLGVGPRGHGISYVIARDEYATSHPEYYLLLNGQRQSGSGEYSKPCLSSTGLLAENVEFVETLFGHYGEPMVNVSPTDGYGNACECALCEGKDTPERGWHGMLSDYVWDYINDLAEDVYLTYPDRKVNSLAYTTYYLPPEEIETLSPNIVVTFCRWRSWFEDPDTQQTYEDVMNDWMDILPNDEFSIWDYYLHARPPGNTYSGIPVYYPWIIRDDLRLLEGESMGDFIEVQRNWPDWNLTYHALAANHLNLYLTAKLYWDVDQDVNALLEEYYTKFYGDAADEMKTFVEYCEANWSDAPGNSTILGQMRTLLNEAISEATGVYADRVELLDDFLAVSEPTPPKNIIVMIADGGGFNHYDSADLYYEGEAGQAAYNAFDQQMAMSTFPSGGSYSSSSAWSNFDYVKSGYTDSAASATAMATGVKTNLGVIGMNASLESVSNVVEQAESLGKATGVVSSVLFNSATPAGFVAHNTSRYNYQSLAAEMINDSEVDVIMGPGHPDYDANGDARTADYTYITQTVWEALEAGTAGGSVDADHNNVSDDTWTFVETKTEFQNLASGTPPKRVFGMARVAVALQQERDGNGDPADDEPEETSYISTVPTLVEMTSGALNILDNDSDGFFLMIEGGAVDMACHANQQGRMIEEKRDFDLAVQEVVDWVTANSSWDETLVIVTADHETGYITVPDTVNDPPWSYIPLTVTQAYEMPDMDWNSTNHTNSLVPFFANGPAAYLLPTYEVGTDTHRGSYIDNTTIGNFIFDLWDSE